MNFVSDKIDPKAQMLTVNSVIPVNGDESVDLENTQLYKKASRSSLTYNSVKPMLFVTTYCIYKSTSYIYLFNN